MRASPMSAHPVATRRTAFASPISTRLRGPVPEGAWQSETTGAPRPAARTSEMSQVALVAVAVHLKRAYAPRTALLWDRLPYSAPSAASQVQPKSARASLGVHDSSRLRQTVEVSYFAQHFANLCKGPDASYFAQRRWLTMTFF